jgi:hypothetical protein
MYTHIHSSANELQPPSGASEAWGRQIAHTKVRLNKLTEIWLLRMKRCVCIYILFSVCVCVCVVCVYLLEWIILHTHHILHFTHIYARTHEHTIPHCTTSTTHTTIPQPYHTHLHTHTHTQLSGEYYLIAIEHDRTRNHTLTNTLQVHTCV